ncbi:MAG: carboxypeptidase regulatory-like domain-containing protein [Patescibacteria group bacterium]
MKSNPLANGFTLVETLVALAIALLFIFAIYGLLSSTLKIVGDDRSRSVALGIARKKLEQIKNLPYDSVGTVGGVPSGTIEPTETEALNNVDYTVTTSIQYVDDPYDELAPTDLLNTDYKTVHITVEWNQADITGPVELTTKLVPTTLERDSGGGTIWIEVFDASTNPTTPVNNADVSIIAPSLGIDTTGKTDADGRFILPGVPPGIEAYHIVVTKPAYSSDQTYDRDPITNPNPDPPHLNVVAGEITEEYFEISQKVNLLGIQLRQYNSEDHLILPFRLHGEKLKGTDTSGLPIYQYDEMITPNDGGNAELNYIPTDIYTIIFEEAELGYVLAGSSARLPLAALPQSSNNISLWLDTYSATTALITVINSAGDIIPDATVHLEQATTFDQTLTTDSYGQVFFNPIVAGTLNLTITATGYTTYSGTFTVNGNEQQTFTLSTAS